MYSPYKAFDRIGKIGSPLPDPYRTYGQAKAIFRRGAVSMVAGVPGSYKSTLALNMAVNWADRAQTTLYFCADSDEFTVTNRLSSILTGEAFNRVEKNVLEGNRENYRRALEDRLKMLVEFEYEQMNWPDIILRIGAYEAVYGAYPDIIFVDNLIDYVSGPMAWDEMQEFIRDCDGLAKKLKSHICILHHARLKDRDKDDDRSFGYPPAAREIQGRLTQKPRMIITLAAANMAIQWAVVKNSLGPQDPEAENPHSFQVYSNLQIQENFRIGREVSI